MELTPEEKAVLAKVCDRLGGHQFDLSQLITPNADGQSVAIRARDVDAVPHISCQRCGRVWLVVTEGDSYEAAEADLNGQLRPDRQRQTRAARRAERAARKAEQARTAAARQVVPAPAVQAATIAPIPVPDA